jgi:hypothetical protein
MIGSLLELSVLAVGIASSVALMWLWETNGAKTPIRPTAEPDTKRGWVTYLQWTSLTILGFAVGAIVNNDILGFSPTGCEQCLRNILAWFGEGACVGAAQWYILRGRVGAASWGWVIATGLGWALGIGLFPHSSAILNGSLAAMLTFLGTIKNLKEFPFAALDYPFGGAALGLFVGVLQWVLLRRQWARSGWWVPASVAGWAVAYVVIGNLGPVQLRTAMAFGMIIGLLTGIALVRLVKTANAIKEGSNAQETLHL